MKKAKALMTLICALMLVLSGCGGERVIAKGRFFTLVRKADGCYINFSQEIMEITDYYASHFGAMTEGMPFNNIRDMKDALVKDTLDRSGVVHLKMKVAYGAGVESARICDPYDLYEPVLPEGMDYGGVLLYGEKYSYYVFSGSHDKDNAFCITTEEGFEARLESYTGFLNNPEYTITQQTDEGGGKTRYKYSWETRDGEKCSGEAVLRVITDKEREYTVVTIENGIPGSFVSYIFVRQGNVGAYLVSHSVDDFTLLETETIKGIKLSRFRG
ncbi:MAG: hypothetical protein PUC05_00775 [Firmicutes bacterium]|nr:hypothetical protein [Bacillota bacterium]